MSKTITLPGKSKVPTTSKSTPSAPSLGSTLNRAPFNESHALATGKTVIDGTQSNLKPKKK